MTNKHITKYGILYIADGMWIVSKTLKNHFVLRVKLKIYKFYVLAIFLLDMSFEEIFTRLSKVQKQAKLVLSVLDDVIGCIVPPPQEICWNLNPQYLWPYLEMGLCRCNWVKMRSSGWTLIQYNWFPYQERKR